jgi:DNA repair photolyase
MFDPVLTFWEPNAPRFLERFECLIHVNEQGFDVSVSDEPYLDYRVDHVAALFDICEPLMSEFWIGKLRQFDNRVVLAGVSDEDIDRFIVPLKAAQDDAMVTALYMRLAKEEKIRWKDSIRDVLEKRHVIEPGNKPIDLATAWGL